jgi:large subunit ribosomal protein L22
MEYIATQKITRQSPRKVRLVANQVKSLPMPEMLQQLAVIEKKSTLVLLKTVRQAIANAQNNHGVALEDLELKELLVNEGPTYKRFQPVSRGQAHKILKRTCHIRVVLRKKNSAQDIVKTNEVMPSSKKKAVTITEASKTKSAKAKPNSKIAKDTTKTKTSKKIKTSKNTNNTKNTKKDSKTSKIK